MSELTKLEHREALREYEKGLKEYLELKAITVKLEEQVREREKRIKESEEERTRLEEKAEYENYRRGCEELQRQNSNLRTGTAEL